MQSQLFRLALDLSHAKDDFKWRIFVGLAAPSTSNLFTCCDVVLLSSASAVTKSKTEGFSLRWTGQFNLGESPSLLRDSDDDDESIASNYKVESSNFRCLHASKPNICICRLLCSKGTQLDFFAAGSLLLQAICFNGGR